MDYSQNTTQLLSIFTVTLSSIWLIFKFLEYRKLPPGPYGVPILGYIPFIKGRMHELFADLEQRYGKVFSLSMGLSRFIVISDGSIAKKVLSHPSAYARPSNIDILMPGKGGFAGQSGKQWIEQRRFCFTAMKNLGLGRGEWERMIHDEAIEFIKEIKNWNGKPTDFLDSLEFAQTNNLLSLLVGRRLCENRYTPTAKILIDFTTEIIPYFSSASLANVVPFSVLKLLAILKIGGYDRILQLRQDFEDVLSQQIKRHMESSNPNEQKQNFIDYYMEEVRKQEKIGDGCHYDEKSLLADMSVLFLGAIDTTKSSLQWLLLLTATYPDVQEKIHREIDEVMGKDRLIYWDERNNLPYIMATISEMLRWVSTTAVFPPRRVTEDFKVDEYFIPKDSIVLVNNWRVLHNPSNFKDPEDFKPERFLESGESLKKSDNYFPFSTGKRNCPGEHVAMMTIFLFYTCIMQKFEIRCPKNSSVKLVDLGSSVVRHPVAQELCFIER